MTRNSLAMLAAALGVLTVAAPGLRAQAPREGIKVHGHWVIEVRNPDGTLTERREFENGLTGGATTLASLLLQQYSMGRWRIYLGGRDGYVVPLPGSSDPTSAFAFGSAPAVAVGALAPGTSGSYNQVVLTATLTADFDGTIKSVFTQTGLCNAATLTLSCTAGSQPQTPNSLVQGEPFTGTTLTKEGQPAPLVLVKGQLVQVTVTISFS